MEDPRKRVQRTTKNYSMPFRAPLTKTTIKSSATELKPEKLIYKIKNEFIMFWKKHWIGTAVILIATIIFFWPLIMHITNYSEGGDSMFNAWTLARNYHCILRESCPNYANGNIYFPNKDTMLYSETQLSAGVLTLPLYLIDKNPIFPYNVWTIASFFFGGWFMYLLAMYLSKDNKFYSILAGLAFEFVPFKMSAISHLQNLSIFYLPLSILMTLMFWRRRQRRYLVFLFIALALQFYASWYQMVFVLFAFGIMLISVLLLKLIDWRQTLKVALVVMLALLSTYPLASAYVQFSKAQQATFSLTDQITYSSSLEDYIKPYNGTLLGKIYYDLRPHAKINSYNPDSDSYQGLVLYVVALIVLVVAFRCRGVSPVDRKRYYVVLVIFIIGLAGFIMSLGPVLKIKGDYIYSYSSAGLNIAIPLPYILIDKFLPQLRFIRAIGRAEVLTLFSLCCSLALFPLYVGKTKQYIRYKYIIGALITFFMIFELMPTNLNPMTSMKYSSYDYSFNIPAVYKFIKAHKQINDYVVIYSDKDYQNAGFPTARAETVLWAGYDNRNIFNGYSGYTPPNYFTFINEFDNFNSSDIPIMKSQGIKYVLLDKQLSLSNPNLITNVKHSLSDKLYEDDHYALFKLPQQK